MCPPATSQRVARPAVRAIVEPLEQRWMLAATADYWTDIPPPVDPVAEQMSAAMIAESSPQVPVGRQPTGALSGKLVFVHPGHGWVDNNGWRTQRPITHGMIEDFGNVDQLNFYVDYLFNAGAMVVPLRPVGYQPNEVIVDNMNLAAGDWIGSWSNSVSSIYYGNPGDAVPYRFATTSTTETAVARYRANLPQGGFYPVYAWAQHGGNRAADQLYRVHHAGGATEVKINHRMVGNGWVYLGTYYFNAGQGGPGNATGGYVEISNRSDVAGRVVIADAIRFGNGVGPSGNIRDDEAGLYWIQAQRGQGVSASVHGSSTVSAPPKWSAHMNRKQEGAFSDRLYISYHSNAFNGKFDSYGNPISDGTARGTVSLFHSSDPTPNQQTLATLMSNEIRTYMQAIGSPPLEYPWANRTPALGGTYSEISNGDLGGQMDGTIVEVAFHDNSMDARLMLDPKARDWVARATYQATVRYFNQFTGSPLVFFPEAPTNVRATVESSGDVIVGWERSPSGPSPAGYMIYVSTDGYGYDGGTFVSGANTTAFTVSNLPAGEEVYYFKVAAVNSGGESMPSEVVAARPSGAGRSQVLIVNGFNRLERFQNPTQQVRVAPGQPIVTVHRVQPWLSNSFNYSIQAAEAIKAFDPRIGIDTVWNHAVRNGDVNLNDYHTIIWLSGEQSTRHSTFTAVEQTAVTSFMANGGKLFVSGSEIGWDLDAQNNGRSFFRNVLRARYLADDAGGYTAAGAAGSIFQNISLTFDNGTLFYDVDFPDRYGTSAGSSIGMVYTGSGSGGAAVVYADPVTHERLVHFGFPFETITTAGNRNAVMARVLSYFQTAPPSAPGNVVAASGEELIQLTWEANSEFDVIGYNVYRSTSPDSGFARINGSPVTNTAFVDDTVMPGVTYYYRIRAVDDWGQESGASAVVSGAATEAPAPEVILASFDRNAAPHALDFVFNMDVSGSLVVEDLELINLTTGLAISPGAMSLSYDGAGNVATWTMSGLSNGILPDGNYQARLVASGVTSPGGRPMEQDHLHDFFYLAGDANGDGRVNIGDLSILAGNWQQSVFGPANGDFNYDGVVNVSDLAILAGNWQVDLQSSGFGVQGSGLDVERSTLDVERSEQVEKTSTAQRSTFNVQEAKRGGGAFGGDERPPRLVESRLGERRAVVPATPLATSAAISLGPPAMVLPAAAYRQADARPLLSSTPIGALELLQDEQEILDRTAARKAAMIR